MVSEFSAEQRDHFTRILPVAEHIVNRSVDILKPDAGIRNDPEQRLERRAF